MNQICLIQIGVERLRASLLSEGWVIVSKYNGQLFLRHPNGNRARVFVRDSSVVLTVNGKEKKREAVGSGFPSPLRM